MPATKPRSKKIDQTTKTCPDKSEKLDLRLSSTDKEKIYSAATAAHKKVSEFVLESALLRADETLADRRRFGLDAEKWAEFMEALDAPPRYHKRMHRLLNEPSVFETNSCADGIQD